MSWSTAHMAGAFTDESLRQTALGAWYAHLIAMPAKENGTAKELLERATPAASSGPVPI